MRFEQLGFESYLSSQALPLKSGKLPSETTIPARVTRVDKKRALVATPAGERRARSAPSLRSAPSQGEQLAVGDWVLLDSATDSDKPVHEDDSASIVEVLPRHSTLSRKTAGAESREQILAANVDTVFVVMGLDGDYNLRRIERYLLMIAASGAAAAVVLNKADLCEKAEQRREEVSALGGGQLDVHLLSALHDEGLGPLIAQLHPGKTVIFVGSSGAGKSTLINRLRGNDEQRVAAVRSRDERGCHTTTARQLFLLPSGAAVIDTPGIREIQLWADEAALREVFSDIEAMAAGCRFRNCSHQSEPGCAVVAGLTSESGGKERLGSYHKLESELAHLAERKSAAGRQQARREGKRFARMAKEAQRRKGRR